MVICQFVRRAHMKKTMHSQNKWDLPALHICQHISHTIAVIYIYLYYLYVLYFFGLTSRWAFKLQLSFPSFGSKFSSDMRRHCQSSLHDVCSGHLYGICYLFQLVKNASFNACSKGGFIAVSKQHWSSAVRISLLTTEENLHYKNIPAWYNCRTYTGVYPTTTLQRHTMARLIYTLDTFVFPCELPLTRKECFTHYCVYKVKASKSSGLTKSDGLKHSAQHNQLWCWSSSESA